MKITKEQAKAYTEVIEVLKYMSKEETDKIPRKVIQYYMDNMDINYDFRIDPKRSFSEQNLSSKAKTVLAIFYRDYWATEEQREKIKQKEKNDLYRLEVEKRKNYDVNNIFEKRQKAVQQESKALVEYKEIHWYNKVFNFMKNIFRRKS